MSYNEQVGNADLPFFWLDASSFPATKAKSYHEGIYCKDYAFNKHGCDTDLISRRFWTISIFYVPPQVYWPMF